MTRFGLLALLAAAALVPAACARKSDPVPPEGAYRAAGPVLAAPGELVEPMRDRTE